MTRAAVLAVLLWLAVAFVAASQGIPTLTTALAGIVGFIGGGLWVIYVAKVS